MYGNFLLIYLNWRENVGYSCWFTSIVLLMDFLKPSETKTRFFRSDSDKLGLSFETNLMSLVSHKKSYFVCVNCWIVEYYVIFILIFFNVQNWDSQQGREIAFLMRNQGHKNNNCLILKNKFIVSIHSRVWKLSKFSSTREFENF